MWPLPPMNAPLTDPIINQIVSMAGLRKRGALGFSKKVFFESVTTQRYVT